MVRIQFDPDVADDVSCPNSFSSEGDFLLVWLALEGYRTSCATHGTSCTVGKHIATNGVGVTSFIPGKVSRASKVIRQRSSAETACECHVIVAVTGERSLAGSSHVADNLIHN